LPTFTRARTKVGCDIVAAATRVRSISLRTKPMLSISSSDMPFPTGIRAVTAARQGHEVVVRVQLANEEVEGRFSDPSRAALLDELDRWLAYLAHSSGAPKGLPASVWARSTAALICDACMKPRPAD
jgi:hypothetical protein